MMKRWLCWLLLAVGVVFLLGIPHRPLRPHVPPQDRQDRSVLSQDEFVSRGCCALRAVSPAFARSRANPLEFLATGEFEWLIAAVTDEDGPPWLHYRAPPDPNACHRGLVGYELQSTFQLSFAPPRANSEHRVFQQALANGVQNVTLAVNLTNVAVPTLLVAGSLDATRSVSVTTLGKISSNDKALFTIQNAKHRHFNSGFCAQTQSSGVIAQAAEAIAGVPSTTRAILDLKTVTNTLIVRNLIGVAMDYCGPDTFFDTVNNPPTYDIRRLVFSLTGFNVTSTNVPTTGLTSDTVKDEVIQRAAAFFNCVFTQTNASCSATQ